MNSGATDAAYDSIASWYDDWVGNADTAHTDPFFRPLLDLAGDITDDAGRSHRSVTDYFTEGFWRSDQRIGPPRTVGAYHRTLDTYLNTLIEAGFVLRRVREVAGPSPGWQQVPPVLAAIVDKPAR